MGNPKQTTINLTNYAQPIKDKLAAYSLKSIVSAGLALLNAVEPTDRERFIGIIAEDDAAEIQAFVDELCARYNAKGKKRNRGQRPARAG